VDGFEIQQITLSYEEYKNQNSRDAVRSAIAAHHGIPRHYLRLVEITKHGKFWYNPETRKTEKI